MHYLEVVMLVKEEFEKAREFYKRAGFVDTDYLLRKGDTSFRLMSYQKR